MKTGILFMNTGTADEPTVVAVRNYLAEFLMDPAIIGAPKFIRQRIVNHIVRNRPQRTVANYEAFWTPEGSPFMIASYKQVKRLEIELSGRLTEDVQVALAMRYGNPSILNGLHELRAYGCDKIVLFPAYPQLVDVCAGTCFKKAHEMLDKLAAEYDWHPEVVEVPYFYHLPSYRKALAKQVASSWQYTPGSKLLVSYHSTMLADIEAGDPYRDQTEATARNLAEDLGIPMDDVVVCYQSRFDTRKWLQPFTEPTTVKLAQEGVKDLCIVCPIFVAENLETALEINRDLRAKYMEVAGADARFTYVHTMDAGAGLIKAFADAIQLALEGNLGAECNCNGITADGSIPIGHIKNH